MSVKVALCCWYVYNSLPQIFSQPIFATFEQWFAKKFPNSGFISKFYTIRPPFLPSFHINLFRLFFRTLYVVSTTGLAIAFPYFNSILGVVGAINFWPLAIYFPLEMYLLRRNIGAWTRKWVVLRTLSLCCFLLTVVGLLGSLISLIKAKFHVWLCSRFRVDLILKSWCKMHYSPIQFKGHLQFGLSSLSAASNNAIFIVSLISRCRQYSSIVQIFCSMT